MKGTSSLPKSFFERVRLNLDSYYGGLTLILFVVRVEGESCWPELIPGKRYLGSGWLSPRVGDFAIFENPKNQNEIFVKKVTAVKGDQYRVASTVSWGSSSTGFGLMSTRDIIGKLLL